MIYNLLLPYLQHIGGVNLFRYITFRTFCALLLSFFICFLLGPKFINAAKKRQGSGQPIRKDGPVSHIKTKQGTPTMGGALIVATILFVTIICGDLSNIYLIAISLLVLAFSMLGFVDDFMKIKYGNSKGINGKTKLYSQITFSLLFAFFVESARLENLRGHLTLPFLKAVTINLGIMLPLFTSFVIVGASNAVNLTDGLDGLAAVPSMLSAACFCIIAYIVGHSVFANYLRLPYIPNAGELCVFCGAMIGSLLGFLWYNAPPAMIFMGDTGSLAAGAALGGISVIVKQEMVLAIVGGIFVVETMSVILQVAYFKKFKKRIFLMAPIHHHFEKKGWNESTVVIRFWIISALCALIGLATLKIR